MNKKKWYLTFGFAVALFAIGFLSAINIGGAYADDNNLNGAMTAVAVVGMVAGASILTYRAFTSN